MLFRTYTVTHRLGSARHTDNEAERVKLERLVDHMYITSAPENHTHRTTVLGSILG